MKKDKRKDKSKSKDKVRKASFKCKPGKMGSNPSGASAFCAKSAQLKYGEYDLAPLPPDARPDMAKANAGKHSYTLSFGGTVEILLSKGAYFVKKIGPKGTGPKGQISWVKNDGPHTSFKLACHRAGLERPSSA